MSEQYKQVLKNGRTSTNDELRRMTNIDELQQ